MSQLSLSVDLESRLLAVSPRHACLRVSDVWTGTGASSLTAPIAVGSLFESAGRTLASLGPSVTRVVQ
jgi:hypothetical protein